MKKGVIMGEWENIEIERLSRLAESLGWRLIMSELIADMINVKLTRKVPLEVIRIREEVMEKEGIPT